MPRPIVILGCTASGKSDLAVRLAEWIAALGIALGSGAELKEESLSTDWRGVFRSEPDPRGQTVLRKPI